MGHVDSWTPPANDLLPRLESMADHTQFLQGQLPGEIEHGLAGGELSAGTDPTVVIIDMLLLKTWQHSNPKYCPDSYRL